MPDPTPEEILDSVAQQPASASVDGTTASSHRLSELLEYAKWKANQTAAAAGRTGLRFFKFEPPEGGS